MDKYDRWKLHNPEFVYSGPLSMEEVIDSEIALQSEGLLRGQQRLADGRPAYRMTGFLPGIQIGSFRIPTGKVRPGQEFVVKMLLDVEPGSYSCIYLVNLWTRVDSRKVARTGSQPDRFIATEPTVRPVQVDLSPFLLMRGAYWMTLSVYAENAKGECGYRYDMLARCAEIDVLEEGQAFFEHPATWKMESVPEGE